MGIFSFKKHDEDDIETKPINEEVKELDLSKTLKGMSEKQLLKLLVLMTYDNNIESIDKTFEEIVEIAKEE